MLTLSFVLEHYQLLILKHYPWRYVLLGILRCVY